MVVSHSEVLCSVRVNPAAGITDEEFVHRFEQAYAADGEIPVGTRARLLRLCDVQLNPARAIGPTHRFILLFEGPDLPRSWEGQPLPGAGAAAQASAGEWMDLDEAIWYWGERIMDTTQRTALPEGVAYYEWPSVAPAASGIYYALTNPTSADVEDAYNDWYTTVHTPDTLMLPGVVRGSRFRRPEPAVTGDPDRGEQRYLAKYEIENVNQVVHANEAMPWMADVSVELRSSAFSGPSVRGFTFAVVTQLPQRQEEGSAA